MKIVLDTNILISGVFFGGYPNRVLRAVLAGELESYVSHDIVDEYKEITYGFKAQKAGRFNEELFISFLEATKVVVPKERIEICRDPDDNKFIECAFEAKALYIVSGDKDLLVLEKYKDIQIITAKAFCEKYLV